MGERFDIGLLTFDVCHLASIKCSSLKSNRWEKVDSNNKRQTSKVQSQIRPLCLLATLA
jgi:hypothetical protein